MAPTLGFPETVKNWVSVEKAQCRKNRKQPADLIVLEVAFLFMIVLFPFWYTSKDACHFSLVFSLIST